jgi:hypothetical protein
LAGGAIEGVIGKVFGIAIGGQLQNDISINIIAITAGSTGFGHALQSIQSIIAAGDGTIGSAINGGQAIINKIVSVGVGNSSRGFTNATILSVVALGDVGRWIAGLGNREDFTLVIIAEVAKTGTGTIKITARAKNKKLIVPVPVSVPCFYGILVYALFRYTVL